PIHEVAIAPGGAWALVAEDWYATRGAPDGLREWLERYRTDEGRRIDHVVLHPDGDRLLWAIISNGPEPAPDAADLVHRVEHGPLHRARPEQRGRVGARLRPPRVRPPRELRLPQDRLRRGLHQQARQLRRRPPARRRRRPRADRARRPPGPRRRRAAVRERAR